MSYSRNGELSVMALLGIEIGLVIYATMSTRASFEEKKRKKASRSNRITRTKRRRDNISQLPDDLLISIIKDFSTKDVVKTSILSKRWRNLYKSVPHMNFDCLNIFGGGLNDHNCCRLQKILIRGVDKFLGGSRKSSCRHQERFIKEVDNFLGLHSGYNRMISCRLACCFTESYPNKVEEWICSLGRLGIEQLSLTFKCSILPRVNSYEERPEFSCQLIYEAPSLQYLRLTRCTLQPNLKSQCNSLKTLRLTKVTINHVAMECIMDNCLNLESLLMERCTLSSKLCICHLQLKNLSVIKCSTLEEIELHAGNLTTFVYNASRLGQLYFRHVPLLEFFTLQLRGEILVHFLFGELAKLSPWRKSSLYKAWNGHNKELSVIYMFRNLRRLDLQYYKLPEKLSDATVLDLCPLLEELNIKATHATSQKKAESRVLDEEQAKKRSVNFHTKLKKVVFHGFSGATCEIEFALYILRNAIALDQMYINCYYRHCLVNSSWRNCGLPWMENKIKSMHQLFQRHVISGRAKIILSLWKLKFILEN